MGLYVLLYISHDEFVVMLFLLWAGLSDVITHLDVA